jgi:predicted nucleic acid-binding protein
MQLVVADTSPIFYLLAIGHIDILPRLFGKVLVPDAVHRELCHPTAPAILRDWSVRVPTWVEVMAVAALDDDVLAVLGSGERAAITLAMSVHADLILIDERKGTSAALNRGLEVTGTLGVLELAARRGFVNLADAFSRLKATNFRYRQEIMDEILARHKPAAG